MLGTIEELEKDLEQFHNNILSSNELYETMCKILGRLNEQTNKFEEKSDILIDNLKELPSIIENNNDANNLLIGETISKELDDTLMEFSKKQNTYLESLDLVKRKLEISQFELKEKYKEFDEKIEEVFNNLNEIPAIIQLNDDKNNQIINEMVSKELDKNLINFSNEQKIYIDCLETMKIEINSIKISLEEKYDKFDNSLNKSLNDLNTIPLKIESINDNNNKVIESLIIEKLEDNLALFKKEQERYIESLNEVKHAIEENQNILNQKYIDFIKDLESMNLSNLSKQNEELKIQLNKKTNMLLILSILSIVLTLAGFFI